MKYSYEELRIVPELVVQFLQTAINEKLNKEEKEKCLIPLNSPPSIFLMFIALHALGSERLIVASFKGKELYLRQAVKMAKERKLEVKILDYDQLEEGYKEEIKLLILSKMALQTNSLYMESWTKSTLSSGKLSRIQTLFPPFLPLGDLYDSQIMQLLDYFQLDIDNSWVSQYMLNMDLLYTLYIDHRIPLSEAIQFVEQKTSEPIHKKAVVIGANIEKSIENFSTPVIPKLSDRTFGIDLHIPKKYRILS